MRGDAAAGLDRCALSAWDAVCAVVREGLLRAGVDPERARALRRAPPAPRAAGRTDAPGVAAQSRTGRSAGDEPKEAEEFAVEDADGLAAMFAEKIGHLVRQYQNVTEPDFAKVSLSELLAWCLARAQDKL